MSATAAPDLAVRKPDIPLPLRPFQLIGRTFIGAFREVGRISIFAARVLIACVTPVIYIREVLRQMMKIGFYSLPWSASPPSSSAPRWR
jgi:hypothetical protein